MAGSHCGGLLSGCPIPAQHGKINVPEVTRAPMEVSGALN